MRCIGNRPTAMLIYKEENLRNFGFWGPASDNSAELSLEQLDQLEDIISDAYPEGIDETQLNDIMAYDFEWVKEALGIEEEDDEEEEEE